jgi:hypothetical protein
MSVLRLSIDKPPNVLGNAIIFDRMNELQQYEAGITLFNSGHFFECHDTLEELWMETHGERRRYLQGLIQLAVGVLHATRGNFSGATSQLSKGIEKLYEYRSIYLGVDVETLVAEATALQGMVLRCLLEGETFDSGMIPAIRYSYDPATMAELR